jgi:DNA-binding transcriptional regulator YdaS (Cro superfamily)
MDLKTYLANGDHTQTSFAELMGVTQGLVHQWLSGRTRITAERAKQIEKVTRGKVKSRDLRPDIFGNAA